MRAAVLAGVVLAGCTEAALGVSVDHVIGGDPTPAGGFPGVGALLIRTLPTSDPVAHCSGTLIAPDAVLTAAHCLDPAAIGPQLPSFSLAHDTRDDPRPVVAGREAIVHEQFDLDAPPPAGLGQYFDLGVLRLAAPITEVAPVAMMQPTDSPALVAGLALAIVGYGVTENGTEGVKYDAETALVAVGSSELRVSAPGQPQNCRGDSGGPAFAALPGGPRLVGTTSRSVERSSQCVSGGIDTRVDVYLAWIHAAVPTGIPCGSGLGGPCAGDEDRADGGCATGARPGPGTLALALAVLARVRRRRSRRPA